VNRNQHGRYGVKIPATWKALQDVHTKTKRLRQTSKIIYKNIDIRFCSATDFTMLRPPMQHRTVQPRDSGCLAQPTGSRNRAAAAPASYHITSHHITWRKRMQAQGPLYPRNHTEIVDCIYSEYDILRFPMPWRSAV